MSNLTLFLFELMEVLLLFKLTKSCQDPAWLLVSQLVICPWILRRWPRYWRWKRDQVRHLCVPIWLHKRGLPRN